MTKEKLFCIAVFLVSFASFAAVPTARAQAANGASCLQPVDCASGYCDQTDPQSSTYYTCQPNPFTPQNMGIPATTQSGGSFVPLAPIPGLTEGATADQAGLANFINNLYKYLIGLAAAIAVVQIIWAGLDIAFFHRDAVSVITDDKGKIYNAVFGLVLVLSPVLVFSIINPSILNLSLNLPPLDTKTGQTTPSTSVPCTSNCNTGATGGSVGALQGIGVDMYSCGTSACSDGKKLCEDRNTPAVLKAQMTYNAVVVCATSGAIDPNGAISKSSNGDAIACKAGENLVANCISQTLAQ